MFTILRTSARGALLITDGVRQCWIQGRWMRPDGTLTPMGMTNWESARLNSEVEAEERGRENVRQAALDRGKEVINVFVGLHVVGETDRAFKVWTGRYQTLYGKKVKSYEYLPKSMVSVKMSDADGTMLSMPRWLYDAKGWLKSITC